MYITLMLIPWLYNNKLAQKKFIDKLYFIDRVTESFNRSVSSVERYESVAQAQNNFSDQEMKLIKQESRKKIQ